MNLSSRTLAVACCLGLPAAARADLPAQWQNGGFHHQGFDVASDPAEQLLGKPSLRIRSTAAILPDGEATAGTGFLADRYRGKRVRFTAQLKTDEVAGWSGLWMRVSAPDDKLGARKKRVRFDNMRYRPVKGTTGWTKYSVVLDVPTESVDVALGFFLVGRGTVWMGTPAIDVVGNDVPVTSTSGENLPPEPQLDLTRQ